MTSSTSHLDRPITHSPPRAWFCAWVAVHDGTSLDAYLRCRLRVYQSRGRRSFSPLPFDIAIVNGEIIVTPNPDFLSRFETLSDDSPEEGGVHYLSRLEMQEILREAQLLEEEDQQVTHLMREMVAAIEQEEAEQVEAIRRGDMRGPRTIARYARKCLRPKLPFPWMPVLVYLAIASMTVVEVFQLTWPLLDILGVDSANLASEFQRNPLAVMGGVASALALTTCLIFLWHFILTSSVVLATGWEQAGPMRTGARLGSIVALSVFLLSGTVAIANLRHGSIEDISASQDTHPGQQDGERTGSFVFVFLSILMPAASAYLQYKMGQSPYWQARRDIRAQQAQWDQDEDKQLLALERRDDALERLQKKRARIEERFARLQARRLALASRVLAAQREWVETLDRERLATEIYALTLLAAIEQDKVHFLRAAYRCQALHLLPEVERCHAQAEGTPHWQGVRPLLPDSRREDES